MDCNMPGFPVLHHLLEFAQTHVLWVSDVIQPSHPFSPSFLLAFPHSSVGKESTCSAGDPGSIPGSGRSAGEGIGYPLQYSWVSLVTQLVENLPAMWESWIWSLGWEGPMKKGKATHSRILAWRIPWIGMSNWATFTLENLNGVMLFVFLLQDIQWRNWERSKLPF